MFFDLYFPKERSNKITKDLSVIFDTFLSGLEKEKDKTFDDVTYEKEGVFYRKINCPGYNKDNILVEVENDVCTITGKMTDNDVEKSFKREYNVKGLDINSITASVKDGVLTITSKLIQPVKNTTSVNVQ